MTEPDRSGQELAGYQYHRSGPVTLYLGDAAEVIAAMPDGSVDTVVTSPPFWSLRDYGTGGWIGGDPGCRHETGAREGGGRARCPRCHAVWTDAQYGLEATLEQYVDRLVGVFDEVRRVLSPTGTCWLNLGDSFTGGGKHARTYPPRASAAGGGQVPPKNLIGAPWRVAFALQASGWWLRSAIIWAKPNPVPESVTDRLSTTYELLFLLTRSHCCYFDLDPIRVPRQRPQARDGSPIVGGPEGASGGVGATARRGSQYGDGKYGHDAQIEPKAARGNLSPVGHAHTAGHPRGRNPGDVWTIATRPYRGSHVAPFPIDLPMRAIAAGCPPGGLVLDPFSGAATTGLAALQLGRRYAGIDIAARFHDEALARLRAHLPGAVPG